MVIAKLGTIIYYYLNNVGGVLIWIGNIMELRFKTPAICYSPDMDTP